VRVTNAGDRPVPDQDSIAVLGLGNVLMGDDALGPTVIAHLQARYDFPENVRVEDLGTPGLDLHPHLAGASALIMVDVVKASGEAGELHQYRKDDILRHLPQARTGPHDPSFKEALLALEFAGEQPDEVLLVGVIPRTTTEATDLSPPVQAAVEGAVAAVCAELERLGSPARPRREPAAPELWWKHTPGEPA
jgi:hydrogenase maturation protease